MSKFKRISNLFVLATFAAGFLLSFWPLCLIGLVLEVFSAQYVLAVLLGLFLDILYGTPAGIFHAVHAPFTALVLLLSLLHYFFSAYFRKRVANTL